MGSNNSVEFLSAPKLNLPHFDGSQESKRCVTRRPFWNWDGETICATFVQPKGEFGD
jgi:hypothetical protein